MAVTTLQNPRELPAAPGLLQHNILISIPRTASNLVTHLLSLPTQPSLNPHPRNGYFFLPSLSYRLSNSTFTLPISAWNDEKRTGMVEALQNSVSAWGAWVEEAEQQGKGTYVKEHINWTLKPYVESAFLHAPNVSTYQTLEAHSTATQQTSNPTAVPDAFWTKLRVTLLIRHPALTFPSCLRTSIDNEGIAAVLSKESEVVQKWECTYRWHVLLYQFLVQQTRSTPDGGRDEVLQAPEEEGEKARGSSQAGSSQAPRAPLIVDASQLQDIAFVRHYASLVNLDPSHVRTQWAATSPEQQANIPPIERRMKDTLLSSSGILASKLDSMNIDINAEKENWDAEFGKVLAGRLEKLVRDAMGDYGWLYERRLRV